MKKTIKNNLVILKPEKGKLINGKHTIVVCEQEKFDEKKYTEN